MIKKTLTVQGLSTLEKHHHNPEYDHLVICGPANSSTFENRPV